MYALMYPILYIASIHCYIPLSTATSISMCSVCIVLWHDHVNGEIKALKKKKKKKNGAPGIIPWYMGELDRYPTTTKTKHELCAYFPPFILVL